MIISKIKKAINKNKSFLILTHVNPDGDALGSQLALRRILKSLNKDVYVVAEERVPPMYKFLPDANKIQTDYKRFKSKFDVVFILDCPKIARVGKVEDLISGSLIINIDHHPGRTKEMDIVFKDTNAAATAVLIYKLFKNMRVKIDKKTALLLYVGIATDTGFFRYTNTDAEAYKISSELVKLGVVPNEINKQLYESESIKRLKLLGLSLETIKLYKTGKIITMETTKDMYTKTGSGPEYTEDFVNFPRSIKGVSVAAFFREDKKAQTVKVSFRAKGKVDVDKIAKVFGGGGHPQASGCTLKGNLKKNKNKVIRVLKKFVE